VQQVEKGNREEKGGAWRGGEGKEQKVLVAGDETVAGRTY
jgi:hypothetical protein